MPASISGDTIVCEPLIENGQVKEVRVRWEKPWNGVKPDEYLIWEHLAYKEFTSTDASVVLSHRNYNPDSTLELYIRWLKNGVKGSYSEKKKCPLKPVPEV